MSLYNSDKDGDTGVDSRVDWAELDTTGFLSFTLETHSSRTTTAQRPRSTVQQQHNSRAAAQL